VGPNQTNLWQITGKDSGQLGNVAFRAIQNLKGGSGPGDL
jgi:hypothetical protein